MSKSFPSCRPIRKFWAACAIIVAFGAGFWISGAIAERWEYVRAHRDGQKHILRSSIYLEIDHPMPDFLVVGNSGEDSVYLSSLVTQRCWILYLPPDAPLLGDDLDVVARVLSAGTAQQRTKMRDLIVVTSQIGGEALEDLLRARGIPLPVWTDCGNVLEDVLNMPKLCICFALDGNSRLRRAGFIGASVDALKWALH
jgi:hypothetical protein